MTPAPRLMDRGTSPVPALRAAPARHHEVTDCMYLEYKVRCLYEIQAT